MADITFVLNEQEQAWLNALIDIALRHSGASALEVAAHFKSKIDAAQQVKAVTEPTVASTE